MNDVEDFQSEFCYSIVIKTDENAFLEFGVNQEYNSFLTSFVCSVK